MTGSDRRFYEDLNVGPLGQSNTLTVDKQAMIAFARQFDPQYFHADEGAAASSQFGEVIASGIYTMALWRQLEHQISHNIAWICGVGWQDVRWPVAVRAGDTLRARTSCLDKRHSDSDAGRGVIRCHYELLNQNDEIVFNCVSTNLIEMRIAAT